MTPSPILLALCPPARAHEPGLSYARIDGDSLSLTFAEQEVALLGGESQIAAATMSRVEIRVDGSPCAVGAPTFAAVEGDGLSLTAGLDCPSGTQWSYAAPFVGSLSPGHRQMVDAFGQPAAVLSASGPEATFAGRSSGLSVAGQYVALGVEHIATGFDHLAFLFALVLVARSLREMLMIVTGFTVAHSITLSLAATGVVTLPSAPVEAAIAGTIVYAGLENLWKPGGRRRVALTFSLGLIHGFGFAGLLAALGLPEGHLATALLSFNAGVELGQAAIVAVVLPLLLFARRWGWWEKWAVPAASIGVAIAGVFWLTERLAGLAG